MARLAGEVCDGFHVHPFHSPRYLDEVHPSRDRRPAPTAAGRAAGACEIVLPGLHDRRRLRRRSRAPQRESVRRQLSFYGSTRTYRPVFELHGWGETSEQLHRLDGGGRHRGDGRRDHRRDARRVRGHRDVGRPGADAGRPLPAASPIASSATGRRRRGSTSPSVAERWQAVAAAVRAGQLTPERERRPSACPAARADGRTVPSAHGGDPHGSRISPTRRSTPTSATRSCSATSPTRTPASPSCGRRRRCIAADYRVVMGIPHRRRRRGTAALHGACRSPGSTRSSTIPSTFSNRSFEPTLGAAFGHTVSVMDPPEHTRYRRILQQAFRPTIVQEWGADIVAPVVDELVGAFRDTGTGGAGRAVRRARTRST